MNMISDFPKYLFHYTNIGALSLILSTKKLKFSRLDLVDDISESENINPSFMAKYCFVSSWCESENENIALWKMYSDDMRGVCLRLPFMPFEFEYKGKKCSYSEVLNSNDLNKKINVNGYLELLKKNNNLLCPNLDVSKNEYWCSIFCKIDYRPDYFETKIDLAPELSNGQIVDVLEILGRYKHLDWKFQNECRYFFIVKNKEISSNNKELLFNREKFYESYERNAPKENAIYIDLHEDSLSKMEILIGPKCNEGDINLINNICQNINSEKVKKSIWYGKIKKT